MAAMLTGAEGRRRHGAAEGLTGWLGVIGARCRGKVVQGGPVGPCRAALLRRRTRAAAGSPAAVASSPSFPLPLFLPLFFNSRGGGVGKP